MVCIIKQGLNVADCGLQHLKKKKKSRVYVLYLSLQIIKNIKNRNYKKEQGEKRAAIIENKKVITICKTRL